MRAKKHIYLCIISVIIIFVIALTSCGGGKGASSDPKKTPGATDEPGGELEPGQEDKDGGEQGGELEPGEEDKDGDEPGGELEPGQGDKDNEPGGVLDPGGDDKDDEEEIKPLPALFSIDETGLKKSHLSPGATIEFSTDTKHMADNADKAIKLSINDSTWGQVLCLRSEDGKEKTIVDPCPEPLSDFDGLRIWADISTADTGGLVPNKLVVIMGNWEYGYRDMFEFHFDIPEGGYKGYIDMPFDEMINGYEPHDKYYNADLIDFIGFKVTASGTMKNVDIYFSDLSAYSEVFW